MGLLFYSVLVFNPLVWRVSAQASSGSFGDSEVPVGALVNWTRFWELFNGHSDWDLEYNAGSGWVSVKGDLRVLKDYRVCVDDVWVSVDRSLATVCKLTLNFTASFDGDYRLTFGVDLDVKNYTYVSGGWNYTLSYRDYVVVFDWSDLRGVSGLVLSHGVKVVGAESWFWFRVRKNHVLAGRSVVLDPSFGYSGGLLSMTITSGVDSEYVSTCSFTITESGDADSITVQLKKAIASDNLVKCAIYRDSDKVLVGVTEERLLSLSVGYTPFTFGFGDPKPSLVGGLAYRLTVWAKWTDHYVYVAYASGTVGQVKYQNNDYDGFPSPWSGLWFPLSRKLSIYCNYTVVKSWHNVSTWAHQLITRQWSLVGTWDFQVITLEWHTISTWFFNLDSRGWHTIAAWYFILESSPEIVIVPILFIFVVLGALIIIVKKRKDRESG